MQLWNSRIIRKEKQELKRKAVLAIMLTLLFIGILSFTFDIQQVEASGTITIKADGSIEGTTDIITVDNITYTFTGNINDSIVVERDDITIDGKGYTLQGTGIYGSKGIALNGRSNISIKDMKIKTFGYGVWLNMSSKSTISGNNITDNGLVKNAVGAGIYLENSSGNTISGNGITNNRGAAIFLFRSSNNSVLGNTFSNNGLYVYDSYENVVEDNLVNGKPLVYLEDVSDYTVYNAGQVILVNCDNILVEKLDLSNTTFGVELWGTNNTKIANNTIKNNLNGVMLEYSSNNNIYGNEIESSFGGIQLGFSSKNNISGNHITNNPYGIRLYLSSNNNIFGNTIGKTNGLDFYYHGLNLYYSSNNVIYHNNFLNNTYQVHLGFDKSFNNTWDNGYPSGGNYWSDYNDTDFFSGPFQNETGSDGIADTPYVIDSNNQDSCPLMGMFSDFVATSEYRVQTICNSSISDFQFNGTAICFNVSGEDDTSGFCRICIPRALMNETYQVFVNGTEVQCNLLPCSNSTHCYLYFTYNHSTQEVIIIPEFPSFLILPLFMAATLLAVIIIRRKHRANLRVPV